ncbi:MAG: tRNA 2-thiouridine(34) synthase MnmA [Patescibacteria group bacterium]
MSKVKSKKRVFVGMSGGVDSSVAAMILKNQGYDVTGVYLKCYVQPDGSCKKDAMDAMEVAERLGIPFDIWDFREAYRRRVIDYMVEGYRQGLTPNPDIECNREIKFGMFLEKALKWGADYVATGHYVKIQKNHPFGTDGSRTPAARDHLPSPRPNLRKTKDQALVKSESSLKNNVSEFSLYAARDLNKDQSYFLWTLKQEQLKHCLFPIGDYLKSEVREMAREAGLSIAEKKDSQGICFVGKVTLDDFLKEYLPEKRGEVLSVSGNKLGEHNGAHFYTIGQRQGIGNIKHQKGVKVHKPLYVVSKDIKTNTVVVAEGGDENLTRKEVRLTGVNFTNPEHSNILENVGVLKVMVRVRYRQPLARACITYHETCIKLDFDEPQKFVAEGQSAVFYMEKGNPSTSSGRRSCELRMIGGGIID